MMSNCRLGVEVVGAHDLMAKDGQGSTSSFVDIGFDGQRLRTTVKYKDLNPIWNEQFYFNISDPSSLHELLLEAYVYNINKSAHSKSFLGKIQLPGTSFVPYSDAVVMFYPLEKRGMLSRVSGELGLKVFLTDDPSSIKASLHRQEKNKSVSRHTRSIPRENHNQASVGEPLRNMTDKIRPESPSPARIVKTYPSSGQPVDYALKETSPSLGGGRVTSTYDLVEQMQYLFVRVVKARDFPSNDITGSLDPFVEVRVGNYKGITKHFEKKQNPEWNEVFAFAKEQVQTSVLEVVVKDKDLVKDDYVGFVLFDMNDVPTRVPPDSPLAPEWYWLEDKRGEKTKKGELMLAIWLGTQADEAFPDAWHSDSASLASSHIKSKVYHAPRLWYVRVNVIEVQDINLHDKTRFPNVFVKAQIGNQLMKTKIVQAPTMNPIWNEEFMFVAAEPFDESLTLSVEDHVGPNKDEIVGQVIIPLGSVEIRTDERIMNTQWYNLEKPVLIDVDLLKNDKFSSRLHIRVCLDGGYHVLDESTHYSSDLRPTAKQLWKSSIGLLELGILKAEGIHPMKTREGRGTSDTYCVAKYGQKWVRTRTIINSLSPKYNEQYMWEVYDVSTVLTVGVFDNYQLKEKGASGNKDAMIGKVRIRLSTLEIGRVYTHSYPLIVLHPSGPKKMGEIHLAIRFSSTSFVNKMYNYSRPLLPKMHYIFPLTVIQLDTLRHQAVQIVAARLSRMEPPLRNEVVKYMCDIESHLWSMRRSKANFFRLVSVFSGALAICKWFANVCVWKNPITTVLVHVLYIMLVCFPELILPTIFLYMFLIGVWNYWYRPQYPPHMNTKISCAEDIHPDELDEEFDKFPTSSHGLLLRMRYDRLRTIAGRMQAVAGDVATQGERIQALLSWRDPRATAIFVLFCLLAALVLYVTPFRVLGGFAGFYMMRHPRLRHRMPSGPINFFRRLPARTDSML